MEIRTHLFTDDSNVQCFTLTRNVVIVDINTGAAMLAGKLRYCGYNAEVATALSVSELAAFPNNFAGVVALRVEESEAASIDLGKLFALTCNVCVWGAGAEAVAQRIGANTISCRPAN